MKHLIFCNSHTYDVSDGLIKFEDYGLGPIIHTWQNIYCERTT